MQCFEHRIEGSCGGLAQMGLEFREGHLDGVQVLGVLGQEEHPCASRSDGGFGPGALVDAEVVKDDDIAGLERWRQLGLDIDVEGGAIPWRRGSPRARSGPRGAGLRVKRHPKLTLDRHPILTPLV